MREAPAPARAERRRKSPGLWRWVRSWTSCGLLMGLPKQPPEKKLERTAAVRAANRGRPDRFGITRVRVPGRRTDGPCSAPGLTGSGLSRPRGVCPGGHTASGHRQRAVASRRAMVTRRPDDLLQGGGPGGPGVVLGASGDGRPPPPPRALRQPSKAVLPTTRVGDRRPALLLHRQRPAKRHLRSRAPRPEIARAARAAQKRESEPPERLASPARVTVPRQVALLASLVTILHDRERGRRHARPSLFVSLIVRELLSVCRR